MLPPIDVVKYADKYWVVDGHNRVALALYMGQVAIDANVVELVPPGARRTEPILPLASTVAASKAVRTAAGGLLPSSSSSRTRTPSRSGRRRRPSDTPALRRVAGRASVRSS